MAVDLSKTRYCEALQCPKRVWLRKYKPDEYDESYDNEAILKQGSEVGDLAMGLFGTFHEIVRDDDRDKMAQDTQIEMKKGTSVITEASFFVDKLFCSVDILRNLGAGNVEIYEVKSSTKVKPIYKHDVAFQYYVLTKAGLNVQKACLVIIDNQYVRGDELDIQQLFKIVDLTDEIRDLQRDTVKNLADIAAYMYTAGDNEPTRNMGKQCFGSDAKDSLHPYDCPFFPYCSRGLPKPNIFDIRGMNVPAKVKFYNDGIYSFEDVLPHVKKEDYKQQVDHELHEIEPYIDKNAIRSFLTQFQYPLYFLDFETINPAIPQYKGTRPYQRQVFQYSLHILESAGGKLIHKEYLGDPRKDSREEIAQRLCQDIPAGACIVAYNASVESGCIQDLANECPQLRTQLLARLTHFVDMMAPFRDRLYYSKVLKGSYSIKDVLPALFPNDKELDYHALAGVHNGGEAPMVYLETAKDDCTDAAIKRQQMLKYCELDTLAMVKIFEKLQALTL